MTGLLKFTDAAVDVVFPLAGQSLPRDHAQALQRSLCAQLPWLNAGASDALTGIHPIKLVPGDDSPALLSRRSSLMLRVSEQRAGDLLALSGLELQVAGYALILGPAHLRRLQAHATLYAYKVAASSTDEVAFMAMMSNELARLAIGGERVCGKHNPMSTDDGEISTFSLMLHALPPEQSLRLQIHGLGPHRTLGCGIFVPHKSASAV